MALNKTQLIKQVAAEAGLKNAEAEKAVKSVFNAISTELKNEKGAVSLIGFGSFSRALRSARTGKNPRSGESIQIPEKHVIKFKAGKGLVGDLNGGAMTAAPAKKAAPKKAAKK